VCARAQSEGELTRETLRIFELESTPIEVLAVALRSRTRPRPRLPGYAKELEFAVCEELFRRHMTQRCPPAPLRVSVLLHLASAPCCRKGVEAKITCSYARP
jgi:hypothetical protein